MSVVDLIAKIALLILEAFKKSKTKQRLSNAKKTIVRIRINPFKYRSDKLRSRTGKKADDT